jgi:4-amino-4-deoxy-L-arabinose transferase-like glycosyltransferase
LGLVYGLGKRLGGRATGLAAAALYGFSGLVLLHGRRAMSEGPLLFFTLLTVWLLARPRPRLALAAVTLAAAFAAKLTALTLVPVAAVALLISAGAPNLTRRRRVVALARRATTFAVVFLASLYALHPALWTSPLAGIDAMRAARAQFLSEQTAFVQAAAPQARLASPGLRLLAAVYHVFYAPLAYADVGNYAAATAEAETRYAASGFNTGWHSGSLALNLVLGSLVLSLALVGLLQAARRLIASARHPSGPPARSTTPGQPSAWVLLVLVAWSATTLAGPLAIAVPAQRYFILLVPVACLWAGAGLTYLVQPFRRTAPAFRQTVTSA